MRSRQAVEGGVIDGCGRRQIQHDYRHACAPHYGQDGGRERIGGDIKKDEVDIRLAEPVAGVASLFGTVHQAQVDHFHVHGAQPLGHAPGIVDEALLQARELRPVSFEPYAEQADTRWER